MIKALQSTNPLVMCEVLKITIILLHRFQSNMTGFVDDYELLADGFTKRLLDRLPKPNERTIIKASYDDLLADFTAKPDEAAKLLKVGETPAPAIPAPELAAWTMVASQILNLDETLTR
jgi:hypothetical protein